MRITLVSDGQMRTPEPNTGGLQRVVYNLGQMLIRRGHLVTLVAAKGSYLEGAVDVVEACPPILGQVSYTEEKIGEAASATEYDALLDVSHTHVAAYNDPEHSVIFHQDVTPIEKHPRPVFISESQRRRVYKGKHGAKVIHNRLLDPPIVSPLMPEGPRSVRQHDVALFLGNLVPHKGAHLAIYVAQKAGVPIWVAGPMLDPIYAKRIKMLCGRQNVTYIGPLNEQEKYRVLAQARMTICVPNQSHIGYHETAQLVAMESAWVGTPVLGSKNGGIVEYVHPETGRCGKNLKRMIELAEEVWEMKAHRDEIMEYAHQHFDWMNVAEKWEKILEEAAQGC